MKSTAAIFYLLFGFMVFAAPPKTAVVVETQDGVMLFAEYVAESDKAATLDVRSAIVSSALCENLPAYLPKQKFKNPGKLASGHCRFVGKPFIVRSLALERQNIKKRYDTTLLTLSASGEKHQLPFYDTARGFAWGFNFEIEQQQGIGPAPGLGLQAFPLGATMDTMQTVDVEGKRATIFPSQNLFVKFSKLDPVLGVFYTPLIPTGAINLINFGVLGLTVENSIQVPELKFLPLKKYHLRLRAGINVGFNKFSQDLYQNNLAVSTGQITLIPVMAQLALYWDLKPKKLPLIFSPYIRLAEGVIFSSVATQVKPEYMSQLAPGAESARSGTYIGNGFLAAAGLEIRPDKWPVAFRFDGGYMMHAQDITGSYIVMNGGVAWHYGVASREPKSLPIQYLGAKSVVLTLKGKAKEPDGTLLASTHIRVYAKGSTTLQKEATADAAGKYSIDLEPGLDYTVEAYKEGHAKSKIDLPLASNDKKTREQDFILAPLVYSLEGVNFKPDSDQFVNKKAEKAILELIKFLESNTDVKIELGGHTAAAGPDDDASRNLSKKRAEAVRQFIIKKGIAESRLTAEGFGGSRPIADGKTAAGAAKNRRVEVRILGE